MNPSPINNINEQQASIAFSRQSFAFDNLFSGNKIIQYKRKRVRDVLMQYLKPDDLILELNSGTGEDAIWLAQNNFRVHATDISNGMQDVLKQKVKESNLQHKISAELCSFTKLNQLQQKGPYDVIFSNFAGLNCTNELDKVLQPFNSLLKPGGVIILVLLPKFCLWEFLLLFIGKFKTAFRRFAGNRGAKANVEGVAFHCWYYNPSYIIQHLKNEFDVLGVEGLCTLIPPSYIEDFAEKHPKLFRLLKAKEDKWKNKYPFKYIGDYYIISLQKRVQE
jgi:ubiquinone/menaquinone biosynthesis C-methylase UbiE